MPISLRMNDKEMSIIRSYAEIRGISISYAVREAILEKIEDEFDLGIYSQEMNKHAKNSKTYTHYQVLKELGLN